MNVEIDCLACGKSFVGRPNRSYCSDRCKQAEKRRRARVKEAQDQLARTINRLRLAVANGNREAQRLQSHRARKLEAYLEQLAETGTEKGSVRGSLPTPFHSVRHG